MSKKNILVLSQLRTDTSNGYWSNLLVLETMSRYQLEMHVYDMIC